MKKQLLRITAGVAAFAIILATVGMVNVASAKMCPLSGCRGPIHIGPITYSGMMCPLSGCRGPIHIGL